MRDDEVEGQRERVLRAPQVVRDREFPFAEDLIMDSAGSVDVSLPVLAKVAALVEALCLGRELRIGPSVVVSVHSDLWASERRRYVVARWNVA